MTKIEGNHHIKEQKHGKIEKLHNEIDGARVVNQNQGHNVKKEIMGKNTKR